MHPFLEGTYFQVYVMISLQSPQSLQRSREVGVRAAPSSGLPSSWPKLTDGSRGGRLRKQHHSVTWQKKLAMTKPENKYSDLSQWKDIALVTCVLWPGCWQSCSGAHLRSWTTLEDTGTVAVVSQSFDPRPCLRSP